MRVLVLVVSGLLVASGCGFPKVRECFPVTSPAVPKIADPPALGAPPASVAGAVSLQVFAQGLDRPIAAAFAPGDDARMFVAQQGGRVAIVRDGQVLPEPFADFTERVARQDREQGLLGIAFHPKSQARERVYFNYTGREDGATYVVEFRTDRDDPDRIDPSTERRVLRIGQPWRNHNGGHLAFGPDWKLYIGVGDGGGQGDPRGNAQRCSSWRGKMLRVDVDADPPSVEILQMGLQNPWRYSFDRTTHEMYVTDQGGAQWESLYILRATNIVGHNFGWPITEGGRCVGGSDCDRAGLTAPAYAYDHGGGCAITGGFVYRGRALPALAGLYWFTDFCSGAIRSVRWKYGKVAELWDWKPALDPSDRVNRVTSFAQDNAGELYLLSQSGVVYALTARPDGATSVR